MDANIDTNIDTKKNAILNSEKEFFLYYPCDNLPDKGWIQTCLQCELYTSNCYFFRTIKNNKKQNINIFSYLCRKCKKIILNDENMENDYLNLCNVIFTNNRNRIIHQSNLGHQHL